MKARRLSTLILCRRAPDRSSSERAASRMVRNNAVTPDVATAWATASIRPWMTIGSLNGSSALPKGGRQPRSPGRRCRSPRPPSASVGRVAAHRKQQQDQRGQTQQGHKREAVHEAIELPVLRARWGRRGAATQRSTAVNNGAQRTTKPTAASTSPRPPRREPSARSAPLPASSHHGPSGRQVLEGVGPEAPPAASWRRFHASNMLLGD
jgi:hypothetical protein